MILDFSLGYILSKEALNRFVNKGLKGNIINGNCNHQQDTGDEDVQIGMCLNSIGVTAVDTRDAEGRHRFHHDNPQHWMLSESWSALEKTYPFYPVKPVILRSMSFVEALILYKTLVSLY